MRKTIDQWKEANADNLEKAGLSSASNQQIRRAWRANTKWGLDYTTWSSILGGTRNAQNRKGIALSDLQAGQIDRNQNSAAYTLEDYKAAGINPALMYGQQSSNASAGSDQTEATTLTDADRSSMAQQKADIVMNAANTAVGLQNQQADTDMKEAQAELIRTQADTTKANSDADVALKGAQKVNAEDLHDLYLATKQYQVANSRYTAQLTQWNAATAHINSDIIAACGMDTAKWNLAQAKWNARCQRLNYKQQKALFDATISLGRANAQHAWKQVAMDERTITGLIIENGMKGKDFLTYDDHLMLDFVNCAATLSNAVTSNNSFNASLKGQMFGASMGRSYTGTQAAFTNIQGNILNTLYERFGRTGHYVTDEKGPHPYKGIDRRLSGVGLFVGEPTADYKPSPYGSRYFGGLDYNQFR